jgi:hypothetical protein
MREKNIKREVLKQLKKEFPNWRRLPRKEKKRIAREVLESAVAKNASNEQTGDFAIHELTNTPVPMSGIMKLAEMEQFVEQTTRGLFSFPIKRWPSHYNDPELEAIDALVDDRVVNRLLAPAGYTPSMRELYPSHYLRAELLKSLRYAEISYRKYCRDVINRMDSKRQRAFIHLPLHRAVTIDHTQLSQFRNSLTVVQLVNLMVYVLHLLVKSGRIVHPFRVCGIDSSDVAVVSCPRPLATIAVGQKKVRIYAELDADCGKRRKKRDKSEYFVGYRIHTLVAIDPRTGLNHPLFSLAAPANHHDNLFLPQLIGFAHAMGLSMDIVTADEGYIDTEQNERIQKAYGVTIITPAKEKALIPDHVDPNSGAVYLNGHCEVPMSYGGRTDTGHEFHCGADECFHAPTCPKWREIPLDAGLFGQIPDQVQGVDQARDIRKNMERCFNLLKHREGLDPLRVKSQHATLVAATLAQMATVVLEILGTRKTETKETLPKQLKMACCQAA